MAKKNVKKIKFGKKKRSLKLEFISMRTLEGLSLDQKIVSILKKVKEGRLVVLDEALDFVEEAKLVTATMEGIDSNFTGIEFCTLPRRTNSISKYITKVAESLTGMEFAKPGLTLVGPSTVIREVKRHPDAFTVSAEL